MRKASQDGGDSTSITSGFDNDVKKPGAGILKSKKASIKRKVQNFSLDSDDGVGEPLLQKDKERIESGNQSAKFFLSKTKTDSMSDKGDEMDKLLDDNKTSVPSMTSVVGITDNRVFANGIKDNQMSKSYASAAPIHNHMNTNVFASNSRDEVNLIPKTQVFAEFDRQKQKSYSPSPLIFTTAKIHTDEKSKSLEPVHVTPLPILSTIEGRFVKIDTTKKDNVPGYPLNVDTTYTNDDHRSGIITDSALKKTAGFECQPFVVTELKTFKYIPSEGKLTDITASKDNITTCRENTQLQDSVTGAVKSAIIGKNNAPYISTAVTVVSPSGSKSSKTISQRTLDSCLSREADMDINKNLQSENVSKNFYTTIAEDPDVINASKNNTTNYLGNKQLQRQKNTTTEDKKNADTGTKLTPIIDEKSKDLSGNISFVKISTNSEKTCSESPIISTLSSKINSGNNTVSGTITATSSITNMPSAQKSVPKSVPMPTNIVMITDTKYTTTNTPLSTVTMKPIVVTHTKPVLGVSPSSKPSFVTTVESKQTKQTGIDNFSKESIITVTKASTLAGSAEAASNKSLLPSDILKNLEKSTGKSTEMPYTDVSNTAKKIPIMTAATDTISQTTYYFATSSQTVSNIQSATISQSVDLKTSTMTTKCSRTQTAEAKSPIVKIVSSGGSSVKSAGLPVSLTSITSKPSTVTTIKASTAKDSPKTTTEIVKAPAGKPAVNKKNNENSNENPDA